MMEEEITRKDEVIPDDKWKFNEEVTRVFENMLSRSIPEYAVMRNLVKEISIKYLGAYGSVLDIGCSNGLSIRDIFDERPECTYTLCDVSEPMLKACRERYKGKDNVTILNNDLRNGVPEGMYDVELSILTIQFTPIEYRHKILKSLYDNLSDDGALIIVEKILGDTCSMDNLLVECYYDMKKENQYTQEQIQTKRKSLEGVLVPITSQWNEELFKSAGFKSIQKFWQDLNFTGWILTK